VTRTETLVHREGWLQWPVFWSAIVVGVLASLATLTIFGLAGIVLGAFAALPGQPVMRWSDIGLGGLILSVFGAFFAFVVGGWVAAKIAGLRYGETAALHGGIVWLTTLPLLLILIALGAGGFFGTWLGSLGGRPGWIVPPTAIDQNAILAARNAALGAITGLLLGLAGSVLGGWLGSEKPMVVVRRGRYPRRLGDTPST
jgi:hypothetical protein